MSDSAGNEVDHACGYMQYSMRSAGPNDPTCMIYKLHANSRDHGKCDCDGERWDPPVIDPNPVCDLCENQELNYVPRLLEDELVETDIAGRMPCGGLYHALSEGILGQTECRDVQNVAGSFCCTSPIIAPASPSDPSLKDLFEECENDNECRSGLCKKRTLEGPSICSSQARSTRRSIGREGRV